MGIIEKFCEGEVKFVCYEEMKFFLCGRIECLEIVVICGVIVFVFCYKKRCSWRWDGMMFV